MCGICGILATNGEQPDQSLVELMCSKMLHRGPDAQGMHAEGPIALGMRRLSIIDLDGGYQPIFNEDRTVAVGMCRYRFLS